jgi:hypothetical protein
MNELKPCPHCGALHPEITSYVGQPRRRHQIKCTECPHVIQCFSSTLDQAKAAWDRRECADLAAAQQEVARLRAALERCGAQMVDCRFDRAYETIRGALNK